MGGNALKNCVTRRYSVEEYREIRRDVYQMLDNLFPQSISYPIEAYKTKESFGDLDILLQSDDLPDNWVALVVDAFKPKEYVQNSNVLSLEYKEFQIDVIATPNEHFQSSIDYFAYNDLGNLLGRLAHSIGLKLGHKGLSYVWRVDTYQFAEEVICNDWETICKVLYVSYTDYVAGFDTLEDIFKFVVESQFFNKDIYLLHNRNNYARTRDKKRKTYTEFLLWIEGYEERYVQRVNKYISEAGKDVYLPYLFDEIPGFKETYDQVQAAWAQETEFKKRYNGEIVSELTGLKTQELGKFMKWIRETQDTARMKKDIVGMNPELISNWIMYWFGQYKEQV